MGGTSESKTKTTAPIKMKYFALFAILALGLAQAAPATDVWELFKTVHKKSYETEAEELLRKEIFLNNVQKVEEHNQKFEAGEVSFKLGVNQFSDLIESEYRASQLGFKKPAAHKSGASGMFVADAGVELATSVDWRKREPSLLSKTKASADPAGPSLPPAQLRELTPSRPETWFPSQRNNWLNAAGTKATKDAMEVLWTMPSITSSPPLVWNPSRITLTLPAVVTAATIASSTNPRLRPPSAHTLM